MALEPARRVEQSGEERRIFRRKRGAKRPEDRAFVGVPASSPRSNDGGRKWLVPPHRWRLQELLEEQSLPDQGLHRRRRLVASAMGDGGFGEQSRYQRNPNRLGESLCHAVLRAIVDRRRGTLLQGNQSRYMAVLPDGRRSGGARR